MLLVPAGDDSIDVSGHFYTIVATNPGARTLTLGVYSYVPSEVYPGDTIKVYSFPTWQVLGTATVAASPTQVSEPSGIASNAYDQELFSGNQPFSSYSYYTVRVFAR